MQNSCLGHVLKKSGQATQHSNGPPPHLPNPVEALIDVIKRIFTSDKTTTNLTK